MRGIIVELDLVGDLHFPCEIAVVGMNSVRPVGPHRRAVARVCAPILHMRSHFASELGRLICTHLNNPKWSAWRVP